MTMKKKKKARLIALQAERPQLGSYLPSISAFFYIHKIKEAPRYSRAFILQLLRFGGEKNKTSSFQIGESCYRISGAFFTLYRPALVSEPTMALLIKPLQHCSSLNLKRLGLFFCQMTQVLLQIVWIHKGIQSACKTRESPNDKTHSSFYSLHLLTQRLISFLSHVSQRSQAKRLQTFISLSVLWYAARDPTQSALPTHCTRTIPTGSHFPLLYCQADVSHKCHGGVLTSQC